MDLELIPEGEERAIDEIEASIRAFVTKQHAAKGCPVRRGAHAKSHGCVEGEFTVEAGLPAELRHGVFAEERTYPVWMRYSSGSDEMLPDTQNDARGLAIKLLGVTGPPAIPDLPGQDFILIDHPVFFARDAVSFAAFARADDKFPHAPLRALAAFAASPEGHAREALLAIQMLSGIENLMEVQYWSETPYRFGSTAVKYSVRPLPGQSFVKPGASSEKVLHDTIRRQLESSDVELEFMVQRFEDYDTTPIEDPTREWKTPFHRVATVRIPKQIVRDPKEDTFAENLSFNLWRCHADGRPLGGINRVRRRLYESSSRLRHELNGVKEQEPALEDIAIAGE